MERVDSEVHFTDSRSRRWARQAEKYIRCGDTGRAQSALGRAERHEILYRRAQLRAAKDKIRKKMTALCPAY
ncbi:MAG: hypothetical protein ACLR0U_17190 [Enterocloster clostridioformis]